jgi:hypothetical protein
MVHVLLVMLVLLCGIFLHSLFAQGIGPINVVLLPALGLLSPFSSVILTNLMIPLFVIFLYLSYMVREYYVHRHHILGAGVYWFLHLDRLFEGLTLFLGSLPGISLGMVVFNFLLQHQSLIFFHYSLLIWVKILVVLMILSAIYYENFIASHNHLAPRHASFVMTSAGPCYQWPVLGYCFLIGILSGFVLTIVGISGVIELTYGLGYRRWSHQDCMFIPQIFLIFSCSFVGYKYFSLGVVSPEMTPFLWSVWLHHMTLILAFLPVVCGTIGCAVWVREKMTKNEARGKLYMNISLVFLCYLSLAFAFGWVWWIQAVLLGGMMYLIMRLYHNFY